MECLNRAGARIGNMERVSQKEGSYEKAIRKPTIS